MTYWSGVVDENDRCFLGGTPYGLMDVFGLRSEEIDGLYDWETNTIIQPEKSCEGMGRQYECRNLCQLVKPSTAKTLMIYGRDFYAGQPALLCNSFGAGKAYYVCADAEGAFYEDLFKKLIREAGITGILEGEIPEGIEVTSREGEQATYIFLQNFNPAEVQIKLPEGEILLGRKDGRMAPLENIVIKRVHTSLNLE